MNPVDILHVFGMTNLTIASLLSMVAFKDDVCRIVRNRLSSKNAQSAAAWIFGGSGMANKFNAIFAGGKV